MASLASLLPCHKWIILLIMVSTPLLSVCRGEEFYKGTDVVELTDATLRSKVLDDRHIWMVEFYAPWCGHCQRLKSDYMKAATASKGIVRFGAINVDEHKSVGGLYGIRGYPTLKIFGVKKNKPEDYNGARTAKAMSDALIALLPNHVSVLKQENYEKFLKKSPEVPKAILFTSKATTSSLYKALALDLKDRMLFGEIRSKKGSDLMRERGIQEGDLPVLLAYPVGEGEGEEGRAGVGEPVKYAGELKHKPLLKFLAKYGLPKLNKNSNEDKKDSQKSAKKSTKQDTSSGSSGGRSASSSIAASRRAGAGLKQIKSKDDISLSCSGGGGFCVLSLLEVRDSAAYERLASIAMKYSRDPLKFVWVDVAQYPKLASSFLGDGESVGEHPTVAILNTKRRKFAVRRGLEGLEGLQATLDRALGGDLHMPFTLSEDWDQALDI